MLITFDLASVVFSKYLALDLTSVTYSEMLITPDLSSVGFPEMLIIVDFSLVVIPEILL